MEPTGTTITVYNVEERNGTNYWKGTSTRFTGTTIEYLGEHFGFNTRTYREGVEPPRQGPLALEPPQEYFPASKPYQDAFREFMKSHEPGHDDFFFYEAYGTRGDVPILLHSLLKMGETTNRWIVCTRKHCVDALLKITGTNVGYNYSDWARWWRETYKTNPPTWQPQARQGAD